MLVVTGEERDDDEALHRRGQVGADELRELIRLALEGERLALHLLVVLELHLEQLTSSTAGPAAPAIATPESSSAGKTFSIRRLAIV